MESKTLDKLVGCRFSSLGQLERKLITLGAKKPNVFESESDLTEDCDFMIDGCIDLDSDNDEDYFTLYYLKDRANNYYITETAFWHENIKNRKYENN
jgi:hypothetical protein